MFELILVLSLYLQIDYFGRCAGIVRGPPLVSNEPMCPYFILRENGKRKFNMSTFMSIKVCFPSAGNVPGHSKKNFHSNLSVTKKSGNLDRNVGTLAAV